VSQPKKKTNLQQMLDDIGISQAQFALLAGMEKYQVSNIASGKKPDCYMSTGKKICKTLAKISKEDVTLDDIFGNKSVSGKFRKYKRKKKEKIQPAPDLIPQEPVTETQTTDTE
jgi:predicted transcriptional regulator